MRNPFCIAEGGGIEIRLTSGNAEKNYDYIINVKKFRRVKPNQS
jgi:hypothetical protein